MSETEERKKEAEAAFMEKVRLINERKKMEKIRKETIKRYHAMVAKKSEFKPKESVESKDKSKLKNGLEKAGKRRTKADIVDEQTRIINEIRRENKGKNEAPPAHPNPDYSYNNTEPIADFSAISRASNAITISKRISKKFGYNKPNINVPNNHSCLLCNLTPAAPPLYETSNQKCIQCKSILQFTVTGDTGKV